tara:strand:+ start:164 stop:625 length:462 start_codon:yes stop_codon:yes gene_type:complete
MQNGKMLGTNKVWGILETIPDPEIPIISIVDLGVVRDVQYVENQLIITVTPTYSGCPAMGFIKEEIVRILEIEGFKDFQLNTVLFPPWTTEWMDEKTRRKIKNAGIAPPEKNVYCPQCNSHDVDIISEFGSTACKAIYKCADCLEPFEYFKCI